MTTTAENYPNGLYFGGNLNILQRRMADAGIEEAPFWWYLDLRRYGTGHQAGFGLGFERTIRFATSMQNIRDIIAFPRTSGNGEF